MTRVKTLGPTNGQNRGVYIRDENGVGRGIKNCDGNIVNIESHAASIHEGNHYFISSFEVIADTESVVFGLEVGASHAHMGFQVAGTSRTEMVIREGAAYNGGASTTPLNNDRNSLNASTIIVVKGPTVTTAGDIILQQSRGLEGTNKVAAAPSGLESFKELILKLNTKYTITITSREDANIVSYIGTWSE